MSDNELFAVIEHIEKVLPQYKGEDLCKRIIRLEGERIDHAAQMLGEKWNGRFSEAHIEIIARTYAEAVRRVVVKATQDTQE
jgi:hypothetical protein